MGTPDFIDLVACDMGSSEVAWPPSSWEGEICDLSLSLSYQVSKEEAALSQTRSLNMVYRQ